MGDALTLYRHYADELMAFATVMVGQDAAAQVVTDGVAIAFSGDVSRIAAPRETLFRAVASRALSRGRDAHPPVFATLTPVQRAVAYFTYWDDLAPRQIGTILGMSEARVRGHLAKADDALRQRSDGTDAAMHARLRAELGEVARRTRRAPSLAPAAAGVTPPPAAKPRITRRRVQLIVLAAMVASFVGVPLIVNLVRDDSHKAVPSESSPAPSNSAPAPEVLANAAAVVSRPVGLAVVDESGVVTNVGLGAFGPGFLVGASLIFTDRDGNVVRQAADGTRTTIVPARDHPVLQDAGYVNGQWTALVRVGTNGFLILVDAGGPHDLTAPPGGFAIAYQTFHLGKDHVVAHFLSDTGQFGVFAVGYDGTPADVSNQCGGCLYAEAPSGRVAEVIGNFLDVDGATLEVPATDVVMGLDVSDTGVAVTFGQNGRATGAAIAFEDSPHRWAWRAAPAGVVTMPRTLAPPVGIVPDTVPGSTPVSLVVPFSGLPPDTPPAVHGFAMAGPSGVVTDRSGLITSEPMSIALQMPDGRVVTQKHSGYGLGWTTADTIPLVWSPGSTAPQPLLVNANWPPDSWIRLDDTARVHGHTMVLFQIERTPNPSAGDTGYLVAADVDLGTLNFLGVVGGTGHRTGRFSMASNGLVVGTLYDETITSLATFHIGDAPTLTAADLGIDAGSSCDGCPRAFAISDDGSDVAWIEQGMIVRRNIRTGNSDTVNLTGVIDPGAVSSIDFTPLLLVYIANRATPDGTQLQPYISWGPSGQPSDFPDQGDATMITYT